MTQSLLSDAERPIVLLHGCGGSSASTFEKTGWLAAIKRAGRPVVAVHLPGHGVIPASHEPTYYSDLTGLIMHELPAEPFDAVGFSLGAKLLLEIALRSPTRVARLVLGGVGDNVFAREGVAEMAARALELGPTPDTPAAVRAFLQTWEPHRNDALAVAAVLRRPPNPVFTPEQLSRITQPVLIVNGEDDPVARQASQLLGSLPDVRRTVLEGVAHFDLPAQAAFIRFAIDFLQEPRP